MDKALNAITDEIIGNISVMVVIGIGIGIGILYYFYKK